MNGLNSRNWSAEERTTDFSGQQWELVVAGQVELPSTSHRAELREAEPQGINDMILILDLEVTQQGIGSQVLTWSAVRFKKVPIDPAQYSEVEIRAGADHLAMIKVRRIES